VAPSSFTEKPTLTVSVGEVSANQEPAIVVSGLKPDHFYNVRVIAVGSNNFQAGSRVIRLRTFGRDGRPQLGNSRLPSSFTPEEPRSTASGDAGDDSSGGRVPFPALEVPTVQEPVVTPARDGHSGGGSGPRRNTVTRRHSPSTTSIDQQPPPREEPSEDPEQTLPELTEKFEKIRQETEDVLAQIAKEEADNRLLLEELEADKQEKRKEQKKKEEQTERLRKDVHSTERAMRNALQRKAQKEKQLKEKRNEREKLYDSIAKWEKGVEEMVKERESFAETMKEMEEERDQKVEQFRAENDSLLAECSRLEQELKEKREQVRELEEARKHLPGGDEDPGEWREKLQEIRREWYRKQRELQDALAFETRRARSLDEQLRILSMQIQHIPQPPYGLYAQPGVPPPMDYDPTALSQLKRRTRPSNSISSVSMPQPMPAYTQMDPAMSVPAPAGFSSARSANAPPGFAPGPFMNLSTDIPSRHDDLSGRTAPLSPSATALLPSNILADIDDDGPNPVSRFDPDPFPVLPRQRMTPDNAPKSPASSGKSSQNLFSSPHGSSSNLPFPAFQNDTADRLSLHGPGSIPSPAASEQPRNKLSGFFSFQRSGPTKTLENEGPLLGSLKPSQSQSFPRQTDDLEVGNKRRVSLSSTWNVFNRNSVGPEIGGGGGSGSGDSHATAAAPGSRLFSRSLNPFSSSRSSLFGERDPSSPRPASIASTEFPRPSTESNSIWGPLGGEKQSRLWSPDVSWSRNPSRRPSLHGSPSALKTSLASAEDEILGEEMVPNVKDVGVIGSRPPVQTQAQNQNQSKAALGRLNPNAPAFIGSLFKSKPDKDKDGKDQKDKAKADHHKKDKDKSSSKAKESKDSSAKDKTKTPDTTPASVAGSGIFDLDSSPLQPRMSRDAISVHTHTSAVSESRDSLSLDQSFSNTPSEPASIISGLSSSYKDDTASQTSGSSNVVRKLFRKSSSSKFGSGLFKKASNTSSAATGAGTQNGGSDKRVSIDRSSDFDDLNEENGSLSFLGRSFDSILSVSASSTASSSHNHHHLALAPTLSSGGKSSTSSSATPVGGAGSSTPKEAKAPVRWLSGFGKKKKENGNGNGNGKVGEIPDEDKALTPVDVSSSGLLAEETNAGNGNNV